ncbi:MAG: hypothetical protein WCJ61_16535 [Paludibacter sp.]
MLSSAFGFSGVVYIESNFRRVVVDGKRIFEAVVGNYSIKVENNQYIFISICKILHTFAALLLPSQL